MVSRESGTDPAGGAGRGGVALHVAVEEELEAIFAGLPPRSDEPDTPGGSPVTSVKPRMGTAGRVPRWGAVAAGLLLAAAVGAGFVRREAPVVVAAPQHAAASIDLAPQPMPAALVLAPRDAPAATPAKAALTPVMQARPKAKPRPAARQAIRRDRETRGECGGYRGEALARCLWPTVMRADRELRRAYERAARDGVARSTMVSYRNRWSDLRHDARREPEKVIAAYRRMSADLDDARGRAEG